MENINILDTANTPKVTFDFDKSLIELEGKSYPENTFDFYKPLLAWINSYFKNNCKDITTVNFKLTYFNSATAQILYDILDILQENSTKELIVNWYYNSDNEQEVEDYEDYSDEFPELNIKAIVL